MVSRGFSKVGDRCGVVFTNITDCKRAEEPAQAANDLLLKALEELKIQWLVIDSANNGITITDVGQIDNPIVFVNPAFEAMTGHSAEECFGRNCRFL